MTTNTASPIRRTLNSLYSLSGGLAAASIVAMMLLVVGQVVARQLNSHIPSSDDISGYLVVWATYFGLAYAMHHLSHIRVEILISRVSPAASKRFNQLSGLIACALVAAFVFYNIELIMESYSYQDKTDGEIPMPLWLVQLPICMGSVLFLISMLDFTYQQFTAATNDEAIT